MGFERAESPSRVKGSALVGLGKAQQPAGEFRRRRKSTKLDQGAAEWVSKGQKALRGSRAAPLWVWAKPGTPPHAIFAAGERVHVNS